METWRTLGGVDEQNIEGTHPLFNNLLRKFGNTRGGSKQKLVMREFLFANATWTVETINTMLRETKRKLVRAKEIRNERPGNQLTAAPPVDFALDRNTDTDDDKEGMVGGADEASIEEEHEREDDDAVDEEADKDVHEEEESDLLESSSALETSANNNVSLYTFNDLDTRIYVCALCKRRILCFARNVHMHEVHTVHIKQEEE